MTATIAAFAAAAADRPAASRAPRQARDPVNQPMINNWVEAIGDANPIYVDEAAARRGRPWRRRSRPRR